MAKYGYVAGFYKDAVSNVDDFENQAEILLRMGIPYNHCFADVFRSNKNKDRYQLRKFLNNIANEGDILIVPSLTCLYSNVRELCCLMYIIEDKGIIIQSNDMDLSSDSASSNWLLASQLAHLDYLHFLRQKRATKLIKKNKYQTTLNIGGRQKRVITPLYRQAYEYLKAHTYTATQHKFHLFKSTLYRIKRQINNKKQPINSHQSYNL